MTVNPQEVGAEVEASPVVTKPVRRPGLFDDPVVRALTVALVVIVILFLSTILAALYLGVLGSDTPRTALDRDLQTYEYQTSGGTQDPEIWRNYISALVDSGQLQKAQQVVDRAAKVVDNKPGADITFSQTQIYYSSKKYKDAIDTATKGLTALTAYHEAKLKDEESAEAKGLPISENYWGILYLRALSYAELGDHKKAIEDFNVYLEERGGAADVLVLRGNERAAVGDKKGAEADYRKALGFIEDLQPAKEGLKKLGVKQ